VYTGFEVAKPDGLCTSATQRRRFLQALAFIGGTTLGVLRLPCARRPAPRDGAFFLPRAFAPSRPWRAYGAYSPAVFVCVQCAGVRLLVFFPLISTGGFINAYARLSRNTSVWPSHRKQGGCRIGGAGVSWTPGPRPYGIPPNRGLAKTL